MNTLSLLSRYHYVLVETNPLYEIRIFVKQLVKRKCIDGGDHPYENSTIYKHIGKNLWKIYPKARNAPTLNQLAISHL